VSWRYLIGVLVILMGGLEIFDVCPGDIWWVSWSYLMGVLVIYVGCLGYI